MNMIEKAKKYESNSHAHPMDYTHLEDFARKMLSGFIKELEDNATGVAWNGGFDSVLFISREPHEKKSLQQIKKEFLYVPSDEDDKDNKDGERSSGDREGN